MKTMHYLRKTTTVVSGAALLLALAGSAFAGPVTVGGGHTAVTNLQGVTITPDLTGECFTVSLASGGGTFDYVLNGLSYTDGKIAQIGGFYIKSPPSSNQVTTTRVVTTTGVVSKFNPSTLNDDTFRGATGYKTSFGNGSPILPGALGTQFCFSAAPGTGATFLLDISQLNAQGVTETGPFAPTGVINFAQLPRPSAVPEPSSVATLAVGSLGLMGMVLSARKRRRANDMI